MKWGLAWHLQAPSSELYFLLSAPAQGEHADKIILVHSTRTLEMKVCERHNSLLDWTKDFRKRGVPLATCLQ